MKLWELEKFIFIGNFSYKEFFKKNLNEILKKKVV